MRKLRKLVPWRALVVWVLLSVSCAPNALLQNVEQVVRQSREGIRVESVSINPSSLTLSIGEQRRLVAALLPTNASNKDVYWTTSAGSVASVDSHGLVMALSLGSSTITATTADGQKTATCNVSTIPLSAAKEITAFSFAAPAATGSIGGTSISISIPHDVNRTALIATFTTTGVAVTVNGVLQASGETANDFTNPVTYAVTAADGSTKTYTVEVLLLFFVNYDSANGLSGNEVWDVATAGNKMYAITADVRNNTVRSTWLERSADGGLTWSTVSQFETIMAVDGSRIYLGGSGLSYSDDEGSSWTSIPQLVGVHVSRVSAISTKLYVGTSDSGIYISLDSGSSWTNYTTANGLVSDQVSCLVANSSGIFVGTVGGLSVSTNGGGTWSNYTTASGLGSNIVYGFTGSTTKMYAATSGGLSVSSDGGANWTNYTSANGLGSSATKCVAIWIYTNNEGWPVGQVLYVGTAGGLSTSGDGGSTWTNYTTINGLGSNSVNRILLKPNGIGMVPPSVYVATDGGLSYRD